MFIVGVVCPLLARYANLTHATNQFIIGPVVNAALIVTATNVKGITKILPLVMLPSIFAMTLGFAFNNPTQAMLMIPFIWAGNMALVLSFKSIFKKDKSLKRDTLRYVIASIVGVGLKAAIIFSGLQIVIATGIPPAPWGHLVWNTFGVYQIITASVGAVAAFGVIMTQARLTNRNQVHQNF